MNSARLDWTTQDHPTAPSVISTELDQSEKNAWNYHWGMQARDEQLAPPGEWRIWLVLAGRGFGKTRAGAEWVREIAERCPEARIALVAATLSEARAVMVEGESGIIACCAPDNRPVFEASLKRLRFPNGAQALIYSAQEPESLRGPQHSHACRAGAEGVLRQPIADRHRRTDRRFAGRPAGKPSVQSDARCVLPGCARRNRGMGRARSSARACGWRRLALHRATCRCADV